MQERVQQKFFGAILQWLRSCRIGPGRTLADYGDVSLAGHLLELEQEHLHKWMPPFAVVLEVARRMQMRVSLGNGVTEPSEGQTILLEEAIGRNDVEDLTKACVDFFAKIPYPSAFWAQLRGIEFALAEPIDLGPFRLRAVGEAHATPQNALLANALAGTTPPRVALAASDVVLEIGVTGYSRQTIADSSVIQALSLLKEFLVLAEAVDVLVRNERAKFQAPTPLLGELIGEPQRLEWVDDVPPNAARRVDNYTLSDGVLLHPQGLFGLAAARPPRDRTAEERAAEIRSRLVRLERVFDRNADKHMMSLRAAAQWYFDSLAENNETTAFLFTCLGLEALLGGDRGETEGVGLKKLLANRLAYLLGGDRATREQLIGEFQGFYDKRSDLVHGRELRLDRVSQQWLTRGREWLRHAIRKEISALLLPPPPTSLLPPPRR